MLTESVQTLFGMSEAQTSTLVLFTIALLLFAAFVRFIYIWSAPYMKELPHPGPITPFFGHYLKFHHEIHRVNEFALEVQKRVGGTRSWALSLPGQAHVVISDPRNVEHVLKTNFDNYIKGSQFIDRFQELLGTGIFNSDGTAWRVQRKTASHLFTMKELKGYMSKVFFHHGLELLRKLEQAAKDPSTVIDLQDLYFQFTFDSICEIAFGLGVGTLRQPTVVYDSQMQPLPQTKWLPFPETTQEESEISGSLGIEFARAFDGVQAAIEKRFYEPHWKILRFFRCSSGERAIAKGVQTLRSFAYNVIAGRRKLAAEHGLGARSDLLTMFIRQSEQQQLDGQPGYDDDYLRDVILNFIIAGRDTTAQALSWSSYLLSLHPDETSKLRKEVSEVIGVNADFSECHKLKYTEAIVSESLRLYPSVPKELKTAVNDDVLPDGTRVKKGWLILFLPYVMGRLEALWPQAERFMPERWMNPALRSSSVPLARSKSFSDIDGESAGTTQLDSVSPFVYPVFQAGPRTCLGKHVALMEVKTILALVFEHFDISLAKGAKVEQLDSVTLPMAHGLKVTVSQRKQIPKQL